MVSIQSLQADYVLTVQYVPNETPGKENFAKLVNALHDGGFVTEVRAGSDASHLLLFIKMKAYEFAERAEIDMVKNYEFGVTSSVIDHSARLRIVHDYLSTSAELGGLGITPGEGDWKFVTSIMPVTGSFDDIKLFDDIKRELGSIYPQNSSINGAIVNTFGPQIGLYFEFFKYYIVWLAVSSVFATITYYVHHHRIFSLSYTIVNIIWGLLFISFWNKRQNFVVNSWGVQNCHLVDQHYSELATINKKFESKSSYQHSVGKNIELSRFLKQLAFVPIALSFTAVLVTYQLLCFVIEILLTEIYNGPLKSLLSLIPIVMMVVFVPILSIVYNFVSTRAIAWENHDNAYTRNNSIVIKQFVLDFLTSYIPLLITSFIYLPFAHLIQPQIPVIKSIIDENVNQNAFYYKYMVQLTRSEDYKINEKRLSGQFFFSIVTNQIILLGVKYIVPVVIAYVTKLIQDYKSKQSPETEYVPVDDEKEATWLESIRNAEKLPVYNVDADFRGLVTQYGFLVIFGAVWPLAPLISLAFNLVNYKLDSMKLVSGKKFKPPIPNRVDSIHPWNYALFGLTWIGSIVGPITTIFYRHGTAPPKTLGQFALDKASVHVSSTAKLLLVLFFTEHLFLVFYSVLNKLLSLSKSEVEWKNDFVDNDIKLRHDYYSGKVKPTIRSTDTENEEIWNSVTVENTLEKAEKLSIAANKKSKDTPVEKAESEKVSTNSTAYSSSAEVGASKVSSRFNKTNDTLTAEEKLLEEKEFLQSVKEDDDKIILSKHDGEQHYATIDDNKHFQPPSKEAVKKVLDEQKEAIEGKVAEAETSVADITAPIDVSTPIAATKAKLVEEIDSKESTPDSEFRKQVGDSVDKAAKKKSSFKKLFKKSQS